MHVVRDINGQWAVWLLHLLAYGVPKVEGLKLCRLNHGINIVSRKVVERLDGSDGIDKLGPACSFPRIGKNFCMGIHQGEPMRKAYIYMHRQILSAMAIPQKTIKAMR